MRHAKTLLALLFATIASAQVQQTTPNIQLALPNFQAPNWNVYVNQNFSTLDTVIGNLQLPYKGTWSGTTIYDRGAQVLYGGSIYTSTINSNFNNTPGVGSAWSYYLSATGGGGGSSVPAGPAYAVQFANSGVSAPAADSSITINPTTHALNVGGVDCTVVRCYTIAPHAALLNAWTLDMFSPSAALASLGGQPLLGFTPENFANKGIANGYPGLDSTALIPISQIPQLPESQIVNLVNDLAALAAGGGGGGGSNPPCTGGQIAYYPSNGTATACDPYVQDTGTGFNVAEPVNVADPSGYGGGFAGTFGPQPTPYFLSTACPVWADMPSQQLMKDCANTGPLVVPGTAAATPGHLKVYGANGVDDADGGVVPSGGGSSQCPAYNHVTPDSGAGSSPTVTVTPGATDCSGYISITVGSSPAAGSTPTSTGFFTIVYGMTHSTVLKCAIIPTNPAAGALVGTAAQPNVLPSASQTTGQFVATVNTTALTSGANLSYYWTCQP